MAGITVDRAVLKRFGALDVVLIATFVLVGELRHGISPMVAPERVGWTTATFLLGWIVSASFLGAYGPNVTSGRELVWRPMLAWIGTVALAMSMRSFPFVPGTASFVFAAVSVGFGTLLLVSGRTVLSYFYNI